MTYLSAVQHCKAKNSQIVEIRSFKENMFVAHLSLHRDLWIGVSDRKREGDWIWETSRYQAAFMFTLWRHGEPNNIGGGRPANCGIMWNEKHFGEWDDRHCGQKKRVVCERPGGEEKVVDGAIYALQEMCSVRIFFQ